MGLHENDNLKMKKSRAGRPRKGETRDDTRVISFRMREESLVNLDKIRDELNELCGIEISRSFMLELILADEKDVEKYKRMLEGDGEQ